MEEWMLGCRDGTSEGSIVNLVAAEDVVQAIRQETSAALR